MGFGSEKFEGVKLTSDEIRYKNEGGPLTGARATVDYAGDIERRITASRLLLTGPFALAFRKKKDHREVYLTVEGQGFAFVVEIDPKKGGDARKFAAKINSAASKLAPA
jgi:hypothetical protein